MLHLQHGAHGVGIVNVNRFLELAQCQTLALINSAKQVVLALEPDEEEEIKNMRLGEIFRTEITVLWRQRRVLRCCLTTVFIDKNADDLPTDYFCESCIIHINRIGFEFEKLNVLLRRDICSFTQFTKQMVRLSIILLNQNPWLSGIESMSSSRVGNEKTIMDTEEGVEYIVLD